MSAAKRGKPTQRKLPSYLLERMVLAGIKDIPQLAIATEIPEQTLYKNLRGERRMSLSTFLKILKALKMDKDQVPIELLRELATISSKNDNTDD